MNRKVTSLAYNTLQSSKPSSLCQLFKIQSPRSTRVSNTIPNTAPPHCQLITKICQSLHSHSCLSPSLQHTPCNQYCDNYLTHPPNLGLPNFTKLHVLPFSPQIFRSRLKALLFSKPFPDSSSSPYLPPLLNSKGHPGPSTIPICLPDSPDLDCLPIDFVSVKRL